MPLLNYLPLLKLRFYICKWSFLMVNLEGACRFPPAGQPQVSPRGRSGLWCLEAANVKCGGEVVLSRQGHSCLSPCPCHTPHLPERPRLVQSCRQPLLDCNCEVEMGQLIQDIRMTQLTSGLRLNLLANLSLWLGETCLSGSFQSPSAMCPLFFVSTIWPYRSQKSSIAHIYKS